MARDDIAFTRGRDRLSVPGPLTLAMGGKGYVSLEVICIKLGWLTMHFVFSTFVDFGRFKRHAQYNFEKNRSEKISQQRGAFQNGTNILMMS